MQAKDVCNFTQDQRTHCDLAVFEKVGLSIDYCLRYAKYGLETLLHVFDHPACFLQSLRQLA